VFNFVSESKGIAHYPYLKAFFVLLHEMVGFKDELSFKESEATRIIEEIGSENKQDCHD